MSLDPSSFQTRADVDSDANSRTTAPAWQSTSIERGLAPNANTERADGWKRNIVADRAAAASNESTADAVDASVSQRRMLPSLQQLARW